MLRLPQKLRLRNKRGIAHEAVVDGVVGRSPDTDCLQRKRKTGGGRNGQFAEEYICIEDFRSRWGYLV